MTGEEDTDYCSFEAARLQTAVDARQWNVIETILDGYCHERITVHPDSVGICSFEVAVEVPPEVVRAADRRRGEKLKMPLRDWPPVLQEKMLAVANHVLEALRKGEEGC